MMIIIAPEVRAAFEGEPGVAKHRAEGRSRGSRSKRTVHRVGERDRESCEASRVTLIGIFVSSLMERSHGEGSRTGGSQCYRRAQC